MGSICGIIGQCDLRRCALVYTLSLNPSLDYIVTVPEFQIGHTNRTESELMLPGGKGINVSTVLEHLGVENKAIYFAAGFVGEEIGRRLEDYGIVTEPIMMGEGCSRINVKLRDSEGTEINAGGPMIAEQYITQLKERLQQLTAGDILVLAGSIPKGMRVSLYAELMAELSGRGIRFVVDAAGEVLRETLQYHPFLIKPNRDEMELFFCKAIETEEEMFQRAEEMQKYGAQNVLISLGGDGAMLLAADGTRYRREAPSGTVVNTVGAGDSMVAGFLAGYLETEDYAQAFRMGLAAGSASVFSERLAEKEEILRICDLIQ